MDDYLVGLAFLAFAIFAFTLVQLKDHKCKRLQREGDQMKIDLHALGELLKNKEREIDRHQRRSAASIKWKGRVSELEQELQAAKKTPEYATLQRLKYLEEYVLGLGRNGPRSAFLMTFPSRGIHTFEERLQQMLDSAEFEVIIVSPWIKRQMWQRIKVPFRRFVQRGGRLQVFMRGCDSDYSLGLSDDIQEDIKGLGGEIVYVKQLHAKLYLVDRKEAIISSANLTKGGAEGNYEAGIWLNDPMRIKDLCSFIDDLHRYG